MDRNSTLGRLIASAAHRLGYTVVPHWQLDHFAAARFLRATFELLAVDCVLDVGANTGQYRDFLRMQVGYAGWIVSFEPIPEHARTLTERAASDPRWQVQACALGRAAGAATFNVMSESQFSSFLSPAVDQDDRFADKNRVARSVDVTVDTLDHCLPGIESRLAPKGIYLKLDTQGFDLEVLAGAGESLPRVVGLQTEASVTPLYQGAPDYAATVSAIRERGFVLSGIFPNNPGHFPTLAEFDCHFVAGSRI